MGLAKDTFAKQNKQNQKLKKKGKLAWKGQFEKWQGFFLHETGYQ